MNEYNAEAERTLTTCDAYDVKASIWLALIVLLGAQVAYLLNQPILDYLRWGQLLSASMLVLAGLATLAELYPRDYQRYSPSNGAIEKRLAELKTFYEKQDNAENLVSHKIIEDQIRWAKQRITVNKGLNENKSQLLVFSFWTAAVAAAINLATLAVIALFSRFH